MDSLLNITLLTILIGAHSPLPLLVLAAFRKGWMPATWLFGAMGILLYYDLGLVLQLAGMPYQSLFFPSLQGASEDSLVWLTLLLAAAPYLLWLGSLATAPRHSVRSPDSLVLTAPRTQGLLVLLLLPMSLALGAFGIYAVWGASSIAATKSAYVAILGSGYIVFMAPMFALGFLVRTAYSRTPPGRALVLGVTLCAMGATLFLGQRTMTLLPVLILLVFWFRLRALHLMLATSLLVAFAAGSVWYYKGYAVRADHTFQDRIVELLNNDFARANVLLRAMDESEWVGTAVLPMPGQGYIHAAMLYVPRRLMPSKGHSTASYFTGMASGQDTEYLGWGLGLGFLEQICLNFGKALLLPGILVYGMLLGLLDRLRLRFPGTLVGACFGAIWMSGYDASAIVLYHGSMVIFALLLELLFASGSAPSRHGLSTQQSGGVRLMPSYSTSVRWR